MEYRREHMIRGKGVSAGIGFGTIVVLKNEERQIEKKTVEKHVIN